MTHDVQEWKKLQLLEKLRSLKDATDIERAHSEADDALIAYIGDPEIKAAYEAVEKWYA